MKLKKLAAVVLTAAMTMATSALAFGASDVTIHFQNAKNWDTVGAHVYEGVGFTTNVTPLDKAFVRVPNEDGNGEHTCWPGAKMEAEGGNWYKITVSYENVAENGLAVIFNNGVGDSKPNDVGFSQADADAVVASGIPTAPTATKEQTANVTLGARAIKKLASFTDLYVTYDGTVTKTFTNNDVPAEYTDAVKAAPAADATAPAGEVKSGDNTTPANNTTAGTPASKGTSTKSNTSVKTGDTVAVSVVAFGILAAVAFVASKKKVNA